MNRNPWVRSGAAAPVAVGSTPVPRARAQAVTARTAKLTAWAAIATDGLLNAMMSPAAVARR